MEKLSDNDAALFQRAYRAFELAKYHLDMLMAHFAQVYKLNPRDEIEPDGTIKRYEKTIEEKLIEFENARTDSD